MDIATTLRKLVALEEFGGTLVTLTLDLAGTSRLPSETRVFLKREFESNLSSEARPEKVRSALRKIAKRVMTFVESGLDAGAKGLYLVAGREAWIPVELKVPLKNFVTVGTHAYLPPFLATEARNPRAYLVEVNANEAVLHELYLGDSEVVRTIAGGLQKEPQQRLRTSRSKEHLSTGPGRGGAARDREQQRQEESGRGLLHQAATAVKELHTIRPAMAVYLAGPEGTFGEFASRLTPELRARAMALGARGGNDLERALGELKALAGDRLRREMQEFHERRAQGLQAALGPSDVLDRLYSGQVSRVYLDEYDPVPGVHCTGCGAREPGLRPSCPFCSLDVVPTSISQDIVTHGRTHPPLDLTFVGHNAGWLRELDGMAALLSTKGARRRTTPALR
jgi:hypothetical protein